MEPWVLLNVHCVFCSAAKFSNLKDCGVGWEESKTNVWEKGKCLHVVLWGYSFKGKIFILSLVHYIIFHLKEDIV